MEIARAIARSTCKRLLKKKKRIAAWICVEHSNRPRPALTLMCHDLKRSWCRVHVIAGLSACVRMQLGFVLARFEGDGARQPTGGAPIAGRRSPSLEVAYMEVASMEVALRSECGCAQNSCALCHAHLHPSLKGCPT